MSREHCVSLLHDIARCGVYRAPRQGMADLIAAAGKAGFSVRRIDLAQVRNKASLFEHLAIALEFPDWFGHNWDALADCLEDLSWLPADGYLIVLDHCDALRASQAGDFAKALQVCASAAAYWRSGNTPFWVLVDMRADDLDSLPDPA